MANKKESKIGVIGAGAWGTALANILAQKQNIKLWAKEKSVCDNIKKLRENKRFLPKIKLSKKINCATEINNVSECEILFLVIPVQYLSGVLTKLKNSLDEKKDLMSSDVILASIHLTSCVKC